MSLLAHYKLNGDVNDASGYGHDGTPTDVSWTTGKIGDCGSFNGSTSKIVVSDHADLQITGDLTLCAWVLLDTLAYSNIVVKRVDDTHREYEFRVEPDGRLRFLDSVYKLYSTGSIGTGAWTHVAVVRSTAASRVYFYINGVAAGDQAWSTPPAATNADVGIGARPGGIFFWLGELDDVRIYTGEVLPLWKIREIFNSGKGSEECQPWQRLIQRTSQPTIRPLTGV